MQAPRSWLGRAVFTLAVVALAVLAFFFVMVFLVVGAILAGALLLRWWWFARKVSRAQTTGTIEGEYAVVKSDDNVPDGARQPDRPRVLPPGGDPQ